jgi:hypothetical protein
MAFRRVLKTDCPGLCNAKKKRQVAISVAMDCPFHKNEVATFMAVNIKKYTNRRIPGKGG